MTSLSSRMSNATDDRRTPRAEDQRHSVAQFELQDPRPPLRVAITGYTIFTTAAVLVFGIWKALASYRGEAILSTTLDWVIGVFFGVFLFWLGRFEMSQPPCLLWFFHKDYSLVLGSAWKHFWSIVRWALSKITDTQIPRLPVIFQFREDAEDRLHEFPIIGATATVFQVRQPRPLRRVAMRDSTLLTEQTNDASTTALASNRALHRRPRRHTSKPHKRALSIAIRYTDLEDPWLLREHAHDEADRMVELLTTKFGYAEENITVLKDCDGPQDCQPSRKNIIQAMYDLVDDARPGDHLVCHISGYGSQAQCLVRGQEEDGYDVVQVFWPMDIKHHSSFNMIENFIRDEDIKRILIDRLPAGASLVLIAGLCHPGTIADLPYGYSGHMLRTTCLRVEERNQSYGGEQELRLTPAVESYGKRSTDSTIFSNVVCWSACGPKHGLDIYIHALIQSICENVSQTHGKLLHSVSIEYSEKMKGHMKLYGEVATLRGDEWDVAAPKPYLSSAYPDEMILERPILETFGGMPINSLISPTANDT